MSRDIAQWVGVSDGYDSVFQKDKFKGHFVRLGAGLWIADENECYPAILELIRKAEKDRLPCLVVPVGDSALSLSLEHQGLKEWLMAKEKICRLTKIQ